MRNSPLKAFANSQGLSPSALKNKRKRDLEAAKSPYRKAAKADAQKKHRNSPANKNMDYDHKTSSFKSVKANRGNDGQGTKKEGNKNYKI